jgi:four helix bundle protein
MATSLSFKDLDAWRVSMELALSVYGLAKHLPATERFALSAQMRKAAVSIPSNLAEGQSTGRNGRFLYHVGVALGSWGELTTQVELALRLGFITRELATATEAELARVGQLLHGLRRSLRLRLLRNGASVVVILTVLSGHLFG